MPGLQHEWPQAARRSPQRDDRRLPPIRRSRPTPAGADRERRRLPVNEAQEGRHLQRVCREPALVARLRQLVHNRQGRGLGRPTKATTLRARRRATGIPARSRSRPTASSREEELSRRETPGTTRHQRGGGALRSGGSRRARRRVGKARLRQAAPLGRPYHGLPAPHEARLRRAAERRAVAQARRCGDHEDAGDPRRMRARRVPATG